MREQAEFVWMSPNGKWQINVDGWHVRVLNFSDLDRKYQLDECPVYVRKMGRKMIRQAEKILIG